MVWLAICKRCKEPWLTVASTRAICPVCGAKCPRFRDGIELPDDVRWSGVKKR